MLLSGAILYMLNIYKTIFSKAAEPLPESPTGIAYV
jgi:hypothetical protein